MENLGVNRSFWQGKRVFLTGHTGFKGAWLSVWLRMMGAKVTGFSLDPATEPALFRVADVAQGMRTVIGDIRDLTTLRACMEEAQPEIVMHLAAQAIVRESYLDPLGTYATNVMGTAHVLDVARGLRSVRAVLVVTSDKCYENREWPWGYRENDAMGGYDPYSSSKGCAELVAAAYRRSFGRRPDGGTIGIATARAGNVIGGGDWSKDRIVPDAMRAFSEGATLRVRNPMAVRPWQHVLEPLRGYLMLCERLWDAPAEYGEAWNFGPAEQDVCDVGRLADRLAAYWGGNAQWRLDEGAHPHEARTLKLECSKARAELKWRPRWDLEKTLEMTVAWYRQYYDGDGMMRKFTERQIEEYEKDVVR